MSSGTPKGGIGLMRQRHSQGGYASSGDDLEDDACSRMTPSSATASMIASTTIPMARTWIEVMENVLWITSAIFIIYFGDRYSNLIYLLWRDDRIRRTPMYLGIVGIVLNCGILFYMSLIAWGFRKSDEKWDVLTPAIAPFVTLLGLSSYFLFSYALWPIWSFLTLPLLFTLFMACIVLSPYLKFWTFRQPTVVLRTFGVRGHLSYEFRSLHLKCIATVRNCSRHQKDADEGRLAIKIAEVKERYFRRLSIFDVLPDLGVFNIAGMSLEQIEVETDRWFWYGIFADKVLEIDQRRVVLTHIADDEIRQEDVLATGGLLISCEQMNHVPCFKYNYM
ncbi:hypothetical protein GIB67_001128 [Kingdonia uniflora]|uniref:Uncharacterized protein n=1 Tax=Kingdonia uniflora TaxID=39325 RepID=A0A7J7MHE2_9MAGN|nr:hypothetical protein GIB67_001128 [Kingdonia uniflora]